MLKARDLGMFYTDNDFLFRHLDIDVASSDILAVLGPNARGKTTLLKTLAGLLQPREGEVTRDGTIGFVPQTRHNSVSYPVIDMVMMGRASTLRAWQSPGRRERDIAYSCLERVEIAQLADTPYSHLSGGQKQLVLIARAIASDPTVLLLDEPTSALDLKNQMRVLEICDVLARDGLGIVFTTHDPSHAALVATRVLAMLPGQSPRIGTAQDLLTSPILSELYDTPIDVHNIHAGGRQHLVATPIFPAGGTPATP